jgi:hypothetical protein
LHRRRELTLLVAVVKLLYQICRAADSLKNAVV